MSWYLAPSLAVLRAEINTRWPGRDRASDGTIGDAAHQASRSDHNPNSRGSVNAIDIDEDGIDVWAVFEAIKKHPSARYFIYERKLYHRLRGWKAEAYSGSNPHDKHFHLSIEQDAGAEQDQRPWGVATAAPPKPSTPKPTTPPSSGTSDWTQELIMSLPTLRRGADGAPVKRLQGLLHAAGERDSRIDGDFGPGTERAVKDFQRAKEIGVDGIVGRQTWTKLIKG